MNCTLAATLYRYRRYLYVRIYGHFVNGLHALLWTLTFSRGGKRSPHIEYGMLVDPLF